MKEINASATQNQRTQLLRTGTNCFNTVKLQNTNNDHAIVPKRVGQARKYMATLSVLHIINDTAVPEDLHTVKMMPFFVCHRFGGGEK